MRNSNEAIPADLWGYDHIVTVIARRRTVLPPNELQLNFVISLKDVFYQLKLEPETTPIERIPHMHPFWAEGSWKVRTGNGDTFEAGDFPYRLSAATRRESWGRFVDGARLLEFVAVSEFDVLDPLPGRKPGEPVDGDGMSR